MAHRRVGTVEDLDQSGLPGVDRSRGTGLVRACTVTRLEVGYSAQTGTDLRHTARRSPMSWMPVEYQTPAIEDRAIEGQMLLSDRVQHRPPSVPDLIIAATAELAGLTVLHYDKYFELIAAVTGQPLESIAIP
jgi:predicted nucleic acid-binding protein